MSPKDYQSASISGATPVQLVCMLYDQLVRDLSLAIKAIEPGDIEARTAEVKHALLVLQQLEAFLDMANGGETAVNLSRFYALARGSIIHAQAKMDPALFRQQIELFMDVRSAWEQVSAAGLAPADAAVNSGFDDTDRPGGRPSLSCSV